MQLFVIICKHSSSDFDQQITTCVLQMIDSSVKFGDWCHKSVPEVEATKLLCRCPWAALLLALAVMWSTGLAGQEELGRSQCSLSWSHPWGHKEGAVCTEILKRMSNITALLV